MLIDLLFVFFVCFAFLFILRKVAKRVGLVDKPSQRKAHLGEIPLVGGVAVCLSLLNYLNTTPVFAELTMLYMFSIFTLTTVGAFDDKFDLSVRLRIGIQALLALAMSSYAGLNLTSLGNVFGVGEVALGSLSTIVTVIAVLAMINAFNMVDGIDGLLGGLSSVTFFSMAVLFYLAGFTTLALFCLVLVVTMLPYIAMNLGLIGRERKVFMGDAGSMMIGFTVIWLFLYHPSGAEFPIIRPVTALWLIAVPLMDMAAIIIRRVKSGSSPFKPDREHLHHICQKLGLSSLQTLLFICGWALIFSLIGIVGELSQVAESLMFYAFVGMFIVYLLLLVNLGAYANKRVNG